MPDDSAARVIAETTGVLGHLRLNRPEALNALDMDMMITIDRTLRAWLTDERVAQVVLTGAGPRGLCAGGDIRASQASRATFTSEDFLRVEYPVNQLISAYPKPYVAVMHGLVLGGGLGLSTHAGFRIVTESTRVGMPEVGIGFIPDVGMTHVLSRLRGESGTHLALTGETIGAGDAIHVGLADHFVEEARLPSLCRDLAHEDAATVIERYASEPPEAALPIAEEWMDAAYRADSAAEVVALLRDRPEPEAQAAATTILTKSPTAVVLALRALRAARTDQAIGQSLDREFRVAVRAFAGAELAEGVRAQLIDRDRRPRWNPAALADVGDDIVDAYFAPLKTELGLG